MIKFITFAEVSVLPGCKDFENPWRCGVVNHIGIMRKYIALLAAVLVMGACIPDVIKPGEQRLRGIIPEVIIRAITRRATPGTIRAKTRGTIPTRQIPASPTRESNMSGTRASFRKSPSTYPRTSGMPFWPDTTNIPGMPTTSTPTSHTRKVTKSSRFRTAASGSGATHPGVARKEAADRYTRQATRTGIIVISH